MISDILQEEKNKVLELLGYISETIEKLQFINMSDYPVSEEFRRNWDNILKKFFSDIENYQKNEFPIVVLGRWNSGKSTFINAILGDAVLPTANKEMTSILTKIYYGKRNEIIAQYEGGRYQGIKRADMSDYVNFRGCKYSKKLKQIDIVTDNSLLNGGLCILDTPGLSSINELNNYITYDIIPKANSIILTFSGSDVGGDENLNLIEQVLRLNFDNQYNMLFVITKYDLLNDDEALEAKDSLKELISIARRRLGLSLSGEANICMVSSYLELKYQQYKQKLISKEDILSDRKLHLSSIEEIERIHCESQFERFYKVLDKSILNSDNKKHITHNLFIMIQNVLTGLLKDYSDMYNRLARSNSTSLGEISKMLQLRVEIETRICDNGQKEIEGFFERINQLRETKNNNSVDEIIKSIYIDLCKYIEDTPYEVISKDKFAELNQQVSMVSTQLITNWMREITSEFDEELQDTIDKIAEIIEENSKEINEVFKQDNNEANLEIYGIRLRSNLALSNFMISFASSASVGAGLFTIGNGILPGVGGIVGSIVGGLVGFIAAMLNLSNSEKMKENLQKRLYKYLFSKKYKYQTTLRELHLQYENVGKLLNQYLDTSLKRTERERNSIIQNYEETKERYESIEQKLKMDINSIKELIPEVNLAFSQYIK